MFLSSETDTDSDWDSDSSDLPNGPMKQALDVDLEDKNKYDFTTNPPETGDQFLLAVRRERKKTPKYTVADMDKIREHKNRKLAKLGNKNDSSSTSDAKSEQASSSGTIPPSDSAITSAKEVDDLLTLGVQRLTLEHPTTSKSVMIQGELNEEKSDEAIRYLPTDLWRHDRVSQFMYMRDKIDNFRAMMQEGQFILLNRFGKTHTKDRTHWLKYCFGTEEYVRMVETKRSRKLATKAFADATRKLKMQTDLAEKSNAPDDSLSSGHSGDEEDEVSDENSDVEFVSREEVKGLELLDGIGKEDDLMKISGGSLEELVVISPQPQLEEEPHPHMLQSVNSEIESEEEEDRTEPQQSVISTAKTTNDNTTPIMDNSPTVQPSEIDTDGKIVEIPAGGNEDTLICAILKEGQGEEKKDNTAAAVPLKETDFTAGHCNYFGASTDTGTDDSIIVDPLQGRMVEDEAAKKEAYLNKYGRDATVHLLLSMPNKLVEYLTTLHLEWVKEFGFMSRRQGSWLYSLMSFIPEPVDPSIVSDLRAAVPSLVMSRDKAMQQIEILSATKSAIKEEKSEEEKETVDSSTEIKQLEQERKDLTKDDDFDAQDQLATCNLFITLIVDFFGQKDLSKFLTGADTQY